MLALRMMSLRLDHCNHKISGLFFTSSIHSFLSSFHDVLSTCYHLSLGKTYRMLIESEGSFKVKSILSLILQTDQVKKKPGKSKYFKNLESASSETMNRCEIFRHSRQGAILNVSN